MEIIYYVAASLDGLIVTPDGGVEWLKPFEGGAEDYGYATYETALQFPEWPYPGEPYWVFSHASGNTPGSVVAEMKSRGLRRAWLVGGGKLAAALRAEGLITQHRLHHPADARRRRPALRRRRHGYRAASL